MVIFSLFGSSGRGQQFTFSTVPAATMAGDKCSRIDVAGVVEVDDFLEAEQIAVVHVRLDETRCKAPYRRCGPWRFGTCLRKRAGVVPRSDSAERRSIRRGKDQLPRR